jgi:hypothetical protein
MGRLAVAQVVAVEEREQRLEHEQRRALVGLRLGVGADDVVRRDLVGHQARSPVAALVDSPVMASLSSSRAMVMRCTSEAPS